MGRVTDESAAGAARPFAALPSVAALIQAARASGSAFTEEVLARAAQDALAREREAIAAGSRPEREEIVARALEAMLALDRPRLSAGINATGVIVHTNLGRAAVSMETAAAMTAAASGAIPLEIDPASNERGGRMSEISSLVRLLTGAEAALAVNNCAAALVLALSAVAAGREVVVSRGEAVEIGGGFRVPDVMRQSGATLVEVGTTNRTYARDYEAASGETTAAWLKVHASNFRIVGFTHAPSLQELASIARPRGIALLEDLGSGAMLDTARFGLAAEPTLAESIAAGVDVTMISGDKLLGGPQAGILAGRAEWISRISRHPLARAVRADKTTLAGLAATLRHYARGDALETIPVWRAISAEADDLRCRAEAMAARLTDAGWNASAVRSTATVGGGSMPEETLSGWGVALDGDDPDGLARRLRLGVPAVYGRIERDLVVLDLRTVMPEDDVALTEAVLAAR
jgi:L-seryl-tRNA(Ser) seleniumtransferase